MQGPGDASYANLSNLAYLEELYARYLQDPQSVDLSWRHFFEGMQFASLSFPKGEGTKTVSPDLRVYHLIEAYRTYGHLLASFNPVATRPPEEVEELSLKKLDFDESELTSQFPTCGFLKTPTATLQEMIDALKKTYCRTIGVEYMGLGVPALEKWLQDRMEPNFELQLTAQQKMTILHFLTKAELFESFLHTKFVGQKRFSLEGEETFIPMLAEIIEVGAEKGMEEVVLGMAHRGRLNVLANILNKSYANIFHEFEDHYTPDLFEGTGDVKYHKGFDGSLSTSTGRPVKVTLTANPSHLESVNPVVEGEVRAKQQKKEGKEKIAAIVPILIHGDAAISGQGVVYETLQLAHLHGYATGGTVHIVINNQIGFTTLPKDARSTRYCTDIAKAVGAPVFHVNAEDPEGCIAVAKIAIEMRQKFQSDVFIDLNGYRKYGHNESDEPTFTQPLEYQLIKEKKSIRELYRDQLISQGILDTAKADQLEAEFKESLYKALAGIKETPPVARPAPEKEEKIISLKTSVDAALLGEIAQKFCTVPKDFSIHPKIQRLLQERMNMLKGDPSKPLIDWGMGEHLAFGSLLWEGVHIRLSGQDCRRGTFSHRHAMWLDQKNEQKYFALSHLKEGQGLFDAFNSPLSEYAVMGFDFGYSLFYPEALIIWEAQFGDFFNGAQIIVDQYLAASEQKWGHRSGLVLMLPHGYEGQGPEHSSGRIERFLQLCGNDNMRIANCTTPAQLFHLLRRQALGKIKKPLILFTPKALLRHPQVVSSLNDFSSGSFQEVIDDPLHLPQVERLLFCSGKIFYDLMAEREKRKTDKVGIIRVEQLYPLNRDQIKEVAQKYKSCQEYAWVQEEHSNMGAWSYIQPIFEEILGKKIRYFGRERSASPAAGSYALHKKQQLALMEEVYTS